MSENVVLQLDEDWSGMKSNCLLDKLQARFLLQAKSMKKYLEHIDEFFASESNKFPIEFYDDRQVLMRAFEEGHTIFPEFLNDSLKKDRELVLHAAKVGPVFDWASSEFLKDFEIVLEMVKYDTKVADHLPASIIKDREKVKMLVQANGEILDSLSMFDSDREIGLLSVRSGGSIPLAFLRDKEFVKEYLLRHPREARDVKDKDLAIEIVKAFPHVLPYLPTNLQRDRDVVYEAIKINGSLLNQISTDKFKQDRELLLAACKTGYSIDSQMVKQFYNDREILIASLESNPYFINCLSKELQGDKEFLKKSLVTLGTLPFNNLPDNLCNDKDFMRELINLNPITYELLSEELRSDRELAVLALKKRGELLEFVK
ncbi:hypothetical protein NAEGRDRAFT_80670 [Naegleria gruberi]|uniref:DUF4116 domain-containing protein n=1 Tax=Naegleria gruberi TaxID=5762 RepID=D2VNT3_NAEGR|nr:uncharacterized protein NAEGRDRAFT_80670 [Naegleria gruberi]EFC41552.1 hypothetical protein NAEGRDRAFT_80670 [Naegleria gruberi]|eukprot:XP_002674296.1 hypothetical protein NAEGRDRAFT_80670 [Naegleria gruberi strain NEG-M]